MRTIAVANRKGGSGKTTTAVSVAAGLAERGLPVLLIDLDPQASASAWLADPSDDRSLVDAFLRKRELESLALNTRVPGLQLVRSTPALVKAERTLLGDLSIGIVRAVQRLPPDWAFVIIDCPPSLSYVSVGALMAVREVVVPVEAHSIALPGAAAVVAEIGRIQASLNPVLRSPLIVACRVNRTLHARHVIDELGRTYGWLFARATIRESIRLAEAESARMPITVYAPESGACLDYRLLAEELLEREEVPEPSPRRESRWRRLLPRSGRVAAFKHRAV